LFFFFIIVYYYHYTIVICLESVEVGVGGGLERGGEEGTNYLTSSEPKVSRPLLLLPPAVPGT
jgi:hypothetical protein